MKILAAGILLAALVACARQQKPDGCSGSIVVATQADWDAVRSCTVVDGDLTIRTTGLASLVGGTNASVVHGSLLLTGNDALEGLSFPLLTEIEGTLDISHNGALQEAGFAGLVHVGGNLTALDNDVASLNGSSLVAPALVRVEGNLTLGGRATWDLSGLAEVHGDLTVTPFQTGGSFPALRTVDGSLSDAVGSSAAVDLHALETVGGSLELDGYTFDLTALRTVGQNLLVNQNGEEGTLLDAPALERVTGGVDIWNVESVNLPALAEVPSLALHGDHVTSVELQSLASAGVWPSGGLSIQGTGIEVLELPKFGSGTVLLSNNPSLGRVSLPDYSGPDLTVSYHPALASLELPSFSSGDLVVDANGPLESIELPNLTSLEQLEVAWNPSLGRLSAPQLAHALYLYIASDPSLPNCEATAILAQLLEPPASYYFSGNDEAATCTP